MRARWTLVEEFDRHAARSFPHPQVRGDKRTLVITIGDRLQEVHVERPIVVIDRKGAVPAEVGAQIRSTARVTEFDP